MKTKLDALVPKAAQAALLALTDLDARDFPYAVTSTYRSAQEQAALFAQGRESLMIVNQKRKVAGLAPIGLRDNSYTVTNCDGYTKLSNHQSGLALDVVPREGTRPAWPVKTDPRWLVIAEAFEKQGFEWGGRWEKFPDLPHYQLV